MLEWILIALSILLMLSVGFPVLAFIRNVKRSNAKIVSDKFAIYSIVLLGLIYIMCQTDLILNVNQGRSAHICSLMSLLVTFSMSFYGVFSHQIFAYSNDVLLIGSKKYNLARIQVKSVKKVFSDRFLINAVNVDYNYMDNSLSLRLTETNFQKYKSLFHVIYK